MQWRVILEPDLETSGWAVGARNSPAAPPVGKPQHEAVKNIREAIALYLEPLQ
jgi:predicted RNase H-like HicB family nuclease